MSNKQQISSTSNKYTEEISRCFSCPQAPCSKACPLHVSPRDFIFFAKKGKYAEAVKAIYAKNPLGLICGLVCPDNFCMKACTRCKIDGAVKIPSIQAALIRRYGQEISATKKTEVNGKKVAVIGSGPAGIGAVWKLLQLGFKVELFEGNDKLGGSLNLIPEERLPREVIEHDYQRIFQSDNFILHLNTMVRKPETLLNQGFCGVIIAVGTQEVNNLGIEGEEHIVSYVDYLSQPEKYVKAQRIAIIGGGKVAADCALIAHKQNAEIIQMLIRRNIADMRMSEAEKEEIRNYGVDIKPLIRVTKVDKQQDILICQLSKTQIIEGKCIDNPTEPIQKEQYDLVIKAIGGGKIAIQENPKIICAGDCKNGATTVVEAIASGVNAAENLNIQI